MLHSIVDENIGMCCEWLCYLRATCFSCILFIDLVVVVIILLIYIRILTNLLVFR